MKNFNFHIVFIFIGTCMSAFSNISAESNLYIENHYGAPIKYKIGTSNSNEPEISVNNMDRNMVGPLSDITTVSIRTTGKGSSLFSYFTELTTTLQQIRIEHTSINKDKDAVIIIKPSKSYQNWDIAIHWENPNKTITELPDEVMAIMNDNVLGKEYDKKARAIYDYDYTKATKGGFVNLRDSLIKEIKEVNRQMYAKSPRKKGVWVAPAASTVDDLKSTITRLYNALQKYKIRDGVK